MIISTKIQSHTCKYVPDYGTVTHMGRSNAIKSLFHKGVWHFVSVDKASLHHSYTHKHKELTLMYRYTQLITTSGKHNIIYMSCLTITEIISISTGVVPSAVGAVVSCHALSPTFTHTCLHITLGVIAIAITFYTCQTHPVIIITPTHMMLRAGSKATGLLTFTDASIIRISIVTKSTDLTAFACSVVLTVGTLG